MCVPRKPGPRICRRGFGAADRLTARLAKLPRGKEIVAYCRQRSEFCVLAVEAVETLRAKGFKAMRLEHGVPEWRAQGFPVVAGNEPR